MSRSDVLNRTFTYSSEDDDCQSEKNDEEFNLKLSNTQNEDLNNEVFFDPVPKNISTITTPRNLTANSTRMGQSMNSTLTKTPTVVSQQAQFDFDEVSLALTYERVNNFFKINFDMYEFIENEQLEWITDEAINEMDDSIEPSPQSFDLFANDLESQLEIEKINGIHASKRFMSEDDLSRMLGDTKLLLKTSSPLKQKPLLMNRLPRVSAPARPNLNVTHSISESSSLGGSNLSINSLNSSDNIPVFNQTYTSLNVNQMQIEADVIKQNFERQISSTNNLKSNLNTTIDKLPINGHNATITKSPAINTTINKSPKQQQNTNLNSTFELKTKKKDTTITLQEKKSSPTKINQTQTLTSQQPVPKKSMAIPRFSGIPRVSNIVRKAIPTAQSLPVPASTTTSKLSPTSSTRTSPKSTSNALKKASTNTDVANTTITKSLPLSEKTNSQFQLKQQNSALSTGSKLAQPKPVTKGLIKPSVTASSIPSYKAHSMKATFGVK